MTHVDRPTGEMPESCGTATSGAERWRITGARIAIADDGEVVADALTIGDGLIMANGADPPDGADRTIDATGLLLLPGIVDLHGDAFERQIMPRAGVFFPIRSALLETDRHLLASGITTAFHGLTASWEPGLRSLEAAGRFLDELASVRPLLAADTRLHLRHEIANLDGEATVASWLKAGAVDLLALNDHTDHIMQWLGRPEAEAKFINRTGLSPAAFEALFDRVNGRASEVPASIGRLAAQARAQGIPMASHDDETPAMRDRFAVMGCQISEFPVDMATARHAIAEGSQTVFGAPNILRGGSHCGRVDAAEAVSAGVCSALTSDYHYPALLQSMFTLARRGVAPLGRLWQLVSANPAAAVGLTDRGRIEAGLRADLILVDASDDQAPRVAATFVAGRLVHADRALW